MPASTVAMQRAAAARRRRHTADRGPARAQQRRRMRRAVREDVVVRPSRRLRVRASAAPRARARAPRRGGRHDVLGGTNEPASTARRARAAAPSLVEYRPPVLPTPPPPAASPRLHARAERRGAAVRRPQLDAAKLCSVRRSQLDLNDERPRRRAARLADALENARAAERHHDRAVVGRRRRAEHRVSSCRGREVGERARPPRVRQREESRERDVER